MKKYFGYHLASSNFFLYKLNIYLFSFILFCSTNIYSQILSAEKIYKKVNGAVVVIHAYDYSNRLSKQGSGVVINDKGYVVTNYHVLEGCERLEIVHNKKIIPYVDIIGVDVEKDILILKIANKKFPAIKIGNSRKLNVGQRVYAIGSPLGFENTISEGIISGLRTIEATGKQFIQITASISSGSSGGAVVNDNGELIAISTLTVRGGQNLNFAIPIEEVLSVNLSSYLAKDAYKDFELFAQGYDAAEKGNYEEAIKYYTRYLEKYPNDEYGYNNRGISKDYLKDYGGAIQDYNKAIEIDPNYAAAFNNRGNGKRGLGDNRGAIQDYNKAIELNPNLAEAYTNRGRAKSDLEDKRGAIQDYTKAIEINPNSADAYQGRGLIKALLEDNRGAIQDFTKVIEINPEYAQAYFNRGLNKTKLEDYRGSIKDYTVYIENNPRDGKAYYLRAGSKHFLRDDYGACQDMSKAGELGIEEAYEFIRIFCN